MCIAILYYRGPPPPTSLLLSPGELVDLGVTPTAKVCSCTGFGTGPSTGGAGYDYDRGLEGFRNHGWCMLLAWGLVLPSGMLVPRFWRGALGASWLGLHQALQIIGLALMAAGFGMAVDATDAWQLDHFDPSVASGHAAIGLVVFLLGSSQLVAFARPHPPAPGESPTAGRRAWLYSHRIGGGLAFVLALVNVQTGADRFAELSDEHDNAQLVYLVALAAAACFGATGYWLGRRTKATLPITTVKPSVAGEALVDTKM